MAKKLTLIVDLVKLGAAIKAHGVKRAKIDDETQLLAMSAINAVNEHGNIHYVNALYLSMGKGARHAALTAWLLAFGGVSANTGKDKGEKPFVFDKGKEVDLVGGEAEPWFEFKVSPEPDAVLDVAKLVAAVIKKASAPKDGQTVAHADLIDGLRGLLEGIKEDATAEE